VYPDQTGKPFRERVSKGVYVKSWWQDDQRTVAAVFSVAGLPRHTCSVKGAFEHAVKPFPEIELNVLVAAGVSESGDVHSEQPTYKAVA
jgi:hypothetical protein